MSECVVRMKTPSSCYVCPLRIACVLYKKWLANEADMPCVYDDGCLIICSLPEGHGRLIDAEARFDELILNSDMNVVSTIHHTVGGILGDYAELIPTIVPADTAERRET